MINPIDLPTQKKALASYIKGLIQDFYNETGQKVAEIKIHSKIEDNKWRVDSVEPLTEMELPLWGEMT